MSERQLHRMDGLQFNLDFTEDNRTRFNCTEMVSYLNTELLPQMEYLFDKLSPHKRVVIPSLELQLGDIDGKNWKSQLRLKLLNKLKDSVLKNKPSATHRAQYSETKSIDEVDQDISQLLFYLIHGHILNRSSREAISQTLIDSLLHDKNKIKAVFSKIVTQHSALLRFIQLLSQGQRELLVIGLYGNRKIKETVLFLKKGINKEANRAWDDAIWITILKVLDGQSNRSEEASKNWLKLIMVHAAHFYFSNFNLSQNYNSEGQCATKNQALSKATGSTSYQNADKGISFKANICSVNLNKYLAPLSSDWKEVLSFSDGTPDGTQLNFKPKKPSWDALVYGLQKGQEVNELFAWSLAGTASRKHRNSEQWPTVSQKSEAPQMIAKETSKAGEELSIVGAGAVIFHPFIKELFTVQNILDGAVFIDRRSQETAVRMLAYLTYGNEKALEYDLLLAKILCGMPLEDALTNDPLSIERIQACDNLLAAILNHWQALNSTSSQWLQQQFFIRQGKLKFTEENIQLRIKSQAQDILLKRLPWSISVIALPWMESPIFVRWEGQ